MANNRTNDLSVRISNASLNERTTISVMPVDGGFGAGNMHGGRMPDVWQLIGTKDYNDIAIYVTDAAVLTIARELIEQRTNGIHFIGHQMSPDQYQNRPAFFATGIDRL